MLPIKVTMSLLLNVALSLTAAIKKTTKKTTKKTAKLDHELAFYIYMYAVLQSLIKHFDLCIFQFTRTTWGATPTENLSCFPSSSQMPTTTMCHSTGPFSGARRSVTFSLTHDACFPLIVNHSIIPALYVLNLMVKSCPATWCMCRTPTMTSNHILLCIISMIRGNDT